MTTLTLRPVEPERDFEQLAALFTLEQDEPTTAASLTADFAAHQARIFRLRVAENEAHELLGFNWATISRFDASQAYFYVIVKPEWRGQGVGRQLYADLEQAAHQTQVQVLKVDLRDTLPAAWNFAVARGFSERVHRLGMCLDLSSLDDRPYQALIERLENEGFQFTSMQALGDTETARRKLFDLNHTATMETPGSEGQPAWLSFEDFQEKVCQTDWYQPAGQFVVIDTASGEWVAMSAITRFEGVDYAYNLFTGVDRHYRGRKLAQAVKILALRYARATLGIKTVQTHHNAQNTPMIAIDRKLGYRQTPGLISMEKTI
jgi:RimJ/RimL family protein N-acetyltransferase/L-amino acid N-acyltransferase YncA